MALIEVVQNGQVVESSNQPFADLVESVVASKCRRFPSAMVTVDGEIRQQETAIAKPAIVNARQADGPANHRFSWDGTQFGNDD